MGGNIGSNGQRQIAEVTTHRKCNHFRLTLAETIATKCKRRTSQLICQWTSQSKSIWTNSSFKNSTARNCRINEIRYVTFKWSQLTITETIVEPIYLLKSHYWQCLSWPYIRDDLGSPALSIITCELSSQRRPQSITQVHLRLYSVHLQRSRVGLCCTCDSHLAMLVVADLLTIAFYMTWWSYLHHRCFGVSMKALGRSATKTRNKSSMRQRSSDPRSFGSLEREVQ